MWVLQLSFQKTILNLYSRVQTTSKLSIGLFNRIVGRWTGTVCFVKPDQWGRYGLLLRPLQANAFMCSIEETLGHEGKMLTYYRRLVDDTLTVMLITSLRPWTTAIPLLSLPWKQRKVACSRFSVHNCRTEQIDTHGDKGLRETNKHWPLVALQESCRRAFRLSSNWSFSSEECDRLKQLFSRLEYSEKLIDSAVTRFFASKVSDQSVSSPADTNGSNPVRIVLPFKDQASADILWDQLTDLSQKIHTNIQPVCESQDRTRPKTTRS